MALHQRLHLFALCIIDQPKKKNIYETGIFVTGGRRGGGDQGRVHRKWWSLALHQVLYLFTQSIDHQKIMFQYEMGVMVAGGGRVRKERDRTTWWHNRPAQTFCFSMKQAYMSRAKNERKGRLRGSKGKPSATVKPQNTSENSGKTYKHL